MGLALCGLATLVALPVLFFGRGSTVEIDASIAANAVGVTTQVEDDGSVPVIGSEATASSLLETVDGNTLLNGGADPTAALQLQRQDEATSSTSVVVTPGSTNRPSSAAGGLSPLAVVEQAVSSSAAAAGNASVATAEAATGASDSLEVASTDAASATASVPSPAPTAVVPSSAPTTTAAPATAAPTTEAPTTLAPTTAAPTTDAPTTTAPVAEAPAETGDSESTPAEADNDPGDAASGVPSADDWAALRACESFGSYTIISSNGMYHGAYQFSVATWNSTAAAAGRPELIDVLPSEASPADQDALAMNLWSRRGFAPWPHCGRGLG